jgi:hypothetical protein
VSVGVASSGATLAIAPHVPLIDDSEFHQDLTHADGTSVIWPTPRAAQIDVAVVIAQGLALYGIASAEIPVITNGAFRTSMLRSDDGKFTNRPVIVVNLSSDTADRTGIGTTTGYFVNDGEQLVDVGELPDGAQVIMKNEASNVTVDVWVFDTNEERANNLYLTIKILMQAAAQTVFMEMLGYIKPPIRTGGNHSTALNLDHPGGEFLTFERQLTYSAQHLDFIGGVAQVINLIKEQLTVSGISGEEDVLPAVNV